MVGENSYGFVNGCCYQIKLLVKQHFELINYGNVCVKRVYKKARTPFSWLSLPIIDYGPNSLLVAGVLFQLGILIKLLHGYGEDGFIVAIRRMR